MGDRQGHKGPYKILPIQEKRRLVDMAREFGVSYIAKEFKVPFNNLSRWEKQV